MSNSFPFLLSGRQEHSLTILIVEDEPGDHHLIEIALRQIELQKNASLDVVWATTLAEGIAKARNPRPDIVILDLSLPDSTGLGTVSAVHAALPDVPIVVLSGHNDEALSMAVLSAGAQDYLVKGQHDAVALWRAMRHALVRNSLENQMSIFHAALEAAADAIIITGTDGTIEWCNRAFEKLSGYGPNEAVGHNPRELLKSGRHDPDFYRDMWSTILDGKAWRGEIVNRRKEGGLYDQTLTIAPVLAGDGTIRKFVAVMHDITDRKRLTQEGAELLRKIELLIQKAGNFDNDSAEATDKNGDGRSDTPSLSTRQREVLILVAQGLTSAEIAERLAIAPTTVVTHRRDLMEKLNLRGVAELTRYAIEHRLVPSSGKTSKR